MAQIVSASIKDGETWVGVDMWSNHIEVTIEHFSRKTEFFPTLTEAFDYVESLKDTKRGLSHESFIHLKTQMASYLNDGTLIRMRKQKTKDYQESMSFLSRAETWAGVTLCEEVSSGKD